MEENQISTYLNSEKHIGFDRVLKLQLKADGWVAKRAGLTSLGPIGFIVGFLFCYLVFVF